MKLFSIFDKLFIGVCLILQTSCIVATKPNPSEKTFFSNWVTSDNSISINLSGGNQGGTNFAATYTFSDKSYCTCTFNVRLTNGRFNASSGSFNNNGCSTTVGSMATMMCPSLTQSGNYVQNGAALMICQSSTNLCYNYK